jgi:hypothetical protein
VGALYRTLDALAASALLDECRPDVKVLADPFVAAAPNLTPRFLAYDPWDEGQAAPANVRASRRALGWLRSGRLLAAFVDDARWSVVVRLARLARCAIVPAAVARTLRETGTIELRFGAPLAPARLAGFATDGEAVGYLRWRVNVLSWRHEAALRLVPRIATAESAAGGQS